MQKAATATAWHPAKGQSQRSTRGAAAGLLAAGLLSSKPGKSGKSIHWLQPKSLILASEGRSVWAKTTWFPAAQVLAKSSSQEHRPGADYDKSTHTALPPIFGPTECAEEKQQTWRSFNNRTGCWAIKYSQSVSHISSWLGLPHYFKQILSEKGETGFLRCEKSQGTETEMNNKKGQVTFLGQKATELVSPHQNIRQYNTRSVLWQVNPTWTFTWQTRHPTHSSESIPAEQPLFPKPHQPATGSSSSRAGHEWRWKRGMNLAAITACSYFPKRLCSSPSLTQGEKHWREWCPFIPGSPLVTQSQECDKSTSGDAPKREATDEHRTGYISVTAPD